VVSSKCLEFEACRYNGVMIPDPFVRKLIPLADFLPVCPEMEIGLGVPRDPIRVVSEKGGLRLIQPSTGLDCTEKMLSSGPAATPRRAGSRSDRRRPRNPRSCSR